MTELRQHLRKATKAEFVCREESGSGELVFDSADLSVGGAFLVSDVLFEQGEVLDLEFGVAGTALRCGARVAWVRRFPGPGEQAGMGVEFLALRDDHRRALELFLGR